MPWKECSVMDERLQFVARQLADEPMRELSQPRQKALPAPVASPTLVGSPWPSASALLRP